MESLGNKLRTAREGKGYTYDKVGDDIHIATRYLKALEAEEYAGFPGEPYLLGFLKNYGEYLGLDTQELLSLYKAKRRQEEPVPVEHLLPPAAPRVSPWLLVRVLICLALLGALGAGVYFFLTRPQAAPGSVMIREPESYVLNTGTLERRFYLGDLVQIDYDDEEYPLELTSLGDAVTITTPYGPVILDLSQEVVMDLNSDGMEELRIVAVDFDKYRQDVGALLRFELDNTLPLAARSVPEPAGADLRSSTPPLPNPSTTGLANATPIFASPNAYPFTLQVSFLGYCMFRWEILSERDRRGRNERYFQKADDINIQAQNGVRIWASNAAAVKLQAIGGGRTVPLELGSAGEVVVADVRWVRDDEYRYRLVLVRLE